jgi:hypothetical protein
MEIKINDTDEKITCRICGSTMKNIAGKHIQTKHNITCDEYKKMFPGAATQSKDYIKATTKNSGKHMQTEEYKKMFSEMIKGEKNPNHKSKTTELERKKRSPFSKDFVGYENLQDRETAVNEFKKEAIKDRLSTTQKEYWLKKGFNLEEAKLKVSERQKTFTLDLCIEKYGGEEGKKIYIDRQNRWQKSLMEGGNLKAGYSEISQELFYSILEYYPKSENLKKVYFSTKNSEYFISLKGGSFNVYDFTDLNKKKMIEYNGDLYHGNPLIYDKLDTPNPFRKYITAEEMWNKDSEKIRIANENGFEVLTIWDSEYKKDKEVTLQKCLTFLNI